MSKDAQLHVEMFIKDLYERIEYIFDSVFRFGRAVGGAVEIKKGGKNEREREEFVE